MNTQAGHRLPLEEHTRHGWRVFEVAADFELIDAWALPATGGRDDFEDFLAVWNSLAAGSGASTWPPSRPSGTSWCTRQ